MTEITPCGYCVDLPEKGRSAAGQVKRCPLCKAELGVTTAGQHFRIGELRPFVRSRRALFVNISSRSRRHVCAGICVDGPATGRT